jgi:hypothetical protein
METYRLSLFARPEVGFLARKRQFFPSELLFAEYLTQGYCLEVDPVAFCKRYIC